MSVKRAALRSKKRMQLQFRVTPEENAWIEKLADSYKLDMTKLIKLSLQYVKKNRPNFVVSARERDEEAETVNGGGR